MNPNCKTDLGYGASLERWDLGNNESVLTFGHKRIMIKGKMSISRLKNALKFKDQIQITCFSDNYSEETRADGNKLYCRNEIFIPIDDIDKVIKILNQIKQEHELEKNNQKRLI